MKFAHSDFAEKPFRTSAAEKSAEKQTSREACTGIGSRWIRRSHAVVALLVGTGGIATPGYIAERGDRGYRLPGIEYANLRDRSLRALSRTTSQNLHRIREAFSPSIMQLAALFRVSRQAIYNWQAGQAISEKNKTKLEELADVADMLEEAGLAESRAITQRKLPGGKTFFQAIYGGESAKSAGIRFASMMKEESEQRARMALRLGKRTRKSADLSSVGTPHLDERA